MSDDPELTQTIQLVEAARGGDEGALNRLFERYLPRTRRVVAMRMGWKLRQLEDHEDLVQEALLKVFQGLQRFEARSEGSFRQWLAQCVECALRDALKHARRQKRGSGRVRRFTDLKCDSLAASIVAVDARTPSQVLQGAQLEEKLEQAILDLPERYREVLVRRSFCGLSYAEIAAELGFKKEGTARQAYARALQKLRDAMAD
ncbi:MAG TPA: sigma-70 family RNA polymerase sigma factor [Planctomycetota bacterium]|nr:sigma-70 family RNA polymerase sigma factor [Planctomycetota bacterium]